jgi:hypothetical protein
MIRQGKGENGGRGKWEKGEMAGGRGKKNSDGLSFLFS